MLGSLKVVIILVVALFAFTAACEDPPPTPPADTPRPANTLPPPPPPPPDTKTAVFLVPAGEKEVFYILVNVPSTVTVTWVNENCNLFGDCEGPATGDVPVIIQGPLGDGVERTVNIRVAKSYSGEKTFFAIPGEYGVQFDNTISLFTQKKVFVSADIIPR